MSAHRVIVAAGSPVFHAMLYGNMKESGQKEIELPNISSSTLKMLFTFIYSGHVQASLMDFLVLLRVADYFDITKLKTMCHELIESEMVFSSKFNSFICFNVTMYAVKHHLDSLVEACLNLMENYATSVIQISWFTSLPLSILTMFVKSPNLEVRELNLFLAIVKWYKQQKDTISDEDAKSLFQNIRYPLIQKSDLVEQVYPTSMADLNLYKAALEYHETDKFDGPEEQLKVRRFYFPFRTTHGLFEESFCIEHTNKGTIITCTNNNRYICECTALIDLRENEPVNFTLTITSCFKSSLAELRLCGYAYGKALRIEISNFPLGKELQGSITKNGREISVEVGGSSFHVTARNDEYGCELTVALYNGEEVRILRS